jgi:hypothetical protein
LVSINVFSKGSERSDYRCKRKQAVKVLSHVAKKSDTCPLQQVSELNKPLNGLMNIRPVIS